MSYSRRAASLLLLALMSVESAQADIAAVRNPPSFTHEERRIIEKDERLGHIVTNCAWQLRQAFDFLDDLRHGSRGVAPDPCRLPNDTARASDEGALDILKILKEAAGQGTSRAGQPRSR